MGISVRCLNIVVKIIVSNGMVEILLKARLKLAVVVKRLCVVEVETASVRYFAVVNVVSRLFAGLYYVLNKTVVLVAVVVREKGVCVQFVSLARKIARVREVRVEIF